MLLGAEWKSEHQCFVKVVKHEPNENDGFVWPAPTFEFYDREGREIEGSRRNAILKSSQPPMMNWTQAGAPVTATELRNRMEASQKRMNEITRKITDSAAKQLAKDVDDHLLDSLMYGQGISMHREDDFKVLRPRNIYKIHTA